MRVNVTWFGVAPGVRPRGFNPDDPSSAGYNWTPVDSEIRALAGHHIAVLMNIWGAPRWAEGANMPRSARPGTWRPNPSALASFALAAARRYDGAYPDPLHPGSVLPRVSYWQGWNEPNLDYYLAPQWVIRRNSYVPVAPVLFRAMTNAFYAAVKSVASSNFVVMGGTAPYGDFGAGSRMQPVAFDRTLFCLNGGATLTPARCPDPIHIDALDNHPYGILGPLQHALNPDDVSIPDQYKLAAVLRAAERFRSVLPRGPKQLWATEFSWDSNPPDPHGVPVQTEARWLEQAFYVVWSQGVSTAMWLQLVDSPPIPSYAASYQAGLYYLNGSPKPTVIAYRFPFVTRRLTRHRVLAWGRAPVGGNLSIQVLRSGTWTSLRSIPVVPGGVFTASLDLPGPARLRAQEGSQTSLTWFQGA
ncbi:MAG: hypothetical protein ACYDHH_12075 [Solirubrobacteraceae bacterium]